MKFAIIGGDLRIVKLADMLAKEGNEIYVYGLEKAEDLKNNSNIIQCDTIKKAIQDVEIVIGPIPFSSNGNTVNAPFSEKEMTIREMMHVINAKVLIAGGISPEVYGMANDEYVEIIDIMKREELAVLNTIATAEGTIKEAIENTEKNIQDSKILVLGFGRVAKVVAKKFKALDAYVTCAARKEEDIAWIKTLGYEAIDINHMDENLKAFDIIINTVPKIILTKKELSYINKQALIIDLASKPGGVDQQAAKEIELKYVWALALPGKVSPMTSAEYIKETIYNIIEKLEKSNYLQK